MALSGAQASSIEATQSLIQASRDIVAPLGLDDTLAILQDCHRLFNLTPPPQVSLADELRDCLEIRTLLASITLPSPVREENAQPTPLIHKRLRARSWSSMNRTLQPGLQHGHTTVRVQAAVLHRVQQEMGLVYAHLTKRLYSSRVGTAEAMRCERALALTKTLLCQIERHSKSLTVSLGRRASDAAVQSRDPVIAINASILDSISEQTPVPSHVPTSLAGNPDTSSLATAPLMGNGDIAIMDERFNRALASDPLPRSYTHDLSGIGEWTQTQTWSFGRDGRL
ncbi:Hypothetical protein D9617_14g075920 [Elsinoe fawcettii]|nr:Hypothetical protein D9617_14g075920 [Elsinoe fawcettii]